MEILVVVALIALLILAFLIFLNPFAQINRSNNTKSKGQITQLSKSFEEFYSNEERYPNASDVCYNDVIQDGSTCSCNICGNEPGSPSFSPYMTSLPCDPYQKRSPYLYQYECTNGSWYKLYAALDVDASDYQYGVSSSNVSVDTYPTIVITPSSVPNTPTTTQTPTPTQGPGICTPGIYCLDQVGNCNICDNGVDESTCQDPDKCNISAGYYDDTSGSNCINVCSLE